jgi:hypothetical protein
MGPNATKFEQQVHHKVYYNSCIQHEARKHLEHSSHYQPLQPVQRSDIYSNYKNLSTKSYVKHHHRCTQLTQQLKYAQRALSMACHSQKHLFTSLFLIYLNV